MDDLSPEDRRRHLEMIAELWSTFTGVELKPADVAAMLTLVRVAKVRFMRESESGDGETPTGSADDFGVIMRTLDSQMIRVYEDAFLQLADKGLFDPATLPKQARDKFEIRRRFRDRTQDQAANS